MPQLDSGAVETCSIKWQSTLLCFAVWWSSLGLADARRTLLAWLQCANCKVWWRKDNGMGWFTRAGIGILLPVKGNLNASAYQDILENDVLPILWEQLGEGHFLFQHYFAPVHKARPIKTWLDEFGVEELDWPTQSHNLNPIKHWNGDCEPGLLVQHQCLTSQMLCWMNGQTLPTEMFLNLMESLFQKS